jgi:DMSO reductase anchor subunit
MWRRSWLSREVLLFSAFSGIASLYAAVLWFGLPGGVALGGLSVIIGTAGVFASACIYRVPARPAWNTRFTVVQFVVTGALLGPLCAAAIGAGNPSWLIGITVSVALSEVVLLACAFLRLIASDRVELRGTARLLSTVLAPTFVLRAVLLIAGGIVVPLVADSTAMLSAAVALTIAGELVGRYLFFVSVVPMHMTTPYLGGEAAA